MDSLPDDILNYLIGIILDNNCLNLSLVNIKIKLMSDVIVSNRLKGNYKILIKNNVVKYPLKSYYCINKIYGGSFTLGYDKLEDLICLSILSNNIELIEIIYKTLPSSIKYVKDKLQHRYDTGGSDLYDLYIKCSNHHIFNHNDEFLNYLKFKELLGNFCQINI